MVTRGCNGTKKKKEKKKQREIDGVILESSKCNGNDTGDKFIILNILTA